MSTTMLFTAHGGVSRPTQAPRQHLEDTTTPRRYRSSPVPSRRIARFTRALLRLTVNLIMVVLVVAFTLVAVLPVTGARAMIVLSGSMEPLLAAGDAAIIRDVPVEDMQVGDVITFHPIGADKRLTTHRIVKLVELDNGLHFQTHGDANDTPDVDLVPANNVVGRYDGMIPQGGRALLMLSSREAKIGLVAVPALGFLIGEIRALTRMASQRSHGRRRTGRLRLAGGVAALTVAAAAGVAATMATMAVLTDVATVPDNTLSTATAW